MCPEQASAELCIECHVFFSEFRSDMTFPNDDTDDMNQELLARRFSEIAGFPNVIGCIDGTQLATKCPTEISNISAKIELGRNFTDLRCNIPLTHFTIGSLSQTSVLSSSKP